MPLPRSLVAGAAALVLCTAARSACAEPPALNVASPDWRDQIVYFVLTDRFADGDPSNDDQGAGEFRAGDPRRYNGGDLEGLRRHLDYIRGLGATALWITPPVANQWFDPWSDYTGYHGYWAADFSRVDRHLGTLADYRRLSSALHRDGMYLVQDIVVNHTGNFFAYRGGWDAADPTRFWVRNTGSRPVTRPTQKPFDLDDPHDPAARRAGIYHWTPDITDYGDPNQRQNFQLSGLDDLNTENPVVRRALRKSYGDWIRKVGVDAFRVDTAFYVPPDFFDDFLHSKDVQAPGIDEVARRTGRRDFLVFGEGFGIDKPFEDRQARRIARYMRAPDGRPLLPGMLNFPLYGAFGDVFARGRPTTELGWAIDTTMRVYPRPHLMPSFVDNHDVDRFLAGGSVAGLKQALLAMMTLPGIPVVYYGTEQGFTKRRAAMFAAGWGSGGRDHYDRGAPLYRYIAGLSALRRSHRVFSRGDPRVLSGNAAGPGALAWTMSRHGETALVALNTADHDVLLDLPASSLPPGHALEGLFGIDAPPPTLTVRADGGLALRLSPRSGQVWRLGRRSAAVQVPQASITLDPLPASPLGADISVGGSARDVQHLRIVVDGDPGPEVAVDPASGRWQARIETGAIGDAAVAHRVVAWAEAEGVVSPAASLRLHLAWQRLAEIDDPAGDDAGPRGRYLYPTDPSYGDRHPMDLRRVTVSGAGGALRLDLKMADVTTSWNPANGFDHVAFTIFIGLPGRKDGATVMPLQNASLPDGMRWQRRLRVHGWSNALFGAEGASATDEGRPVTPGATVRVDAAQDLISFVLPPAALGGLKSLAGLKLYVTTWDYDGGYRPLAPAPRPDAIGGGDPARDAKVMDDTPVITLP